MNIAAHSPVLAPDLAPDLVANIEHIPFATDGGVGENANLGLLVLQTDQTIEDEFRFALPASVALYGARLRSPADITPETLRAMETEIAPTVGLLPTVRFDVVGFGCTSGSLVIGAERVAQRVREALPGVQVTDPFTAGIAALKALGVRRVGLLTPYIATINHSLREAIMARGLAVPVMGSFNESDDDRVARIATASIEDAIIAVGEAPACDAVFVSCTSLRVARAVARIEERLGKPVTSSNHALAWHMLRLAGQTQPQPGLGRLFTV